MAETPLALARKAAEYLEPRGVSNARLEAELMLAAILGVDRLHLYLQFDRPLAVDEVEAYRASIRRRARREPVQYIIGHVAFRELELRVDRRALIPRPETEVLVGEVLTWARAHAPAATPGHPSGGGGILPVSAVDLGTGTGAIALSLAGEGAFERVVATDASADALALAADNARALGLSERVELRCGALWEALREGERFDVIVSNPPYIADREREELAPEVRDWEPPSALFAGSDGLDVIRGLVAGAPDHLRGGGLLALEIGYGQSDRVVALLRESGRFGTPRVARDLAGRERVVLAETQ